jgi:transposase
MGRAYSLDLRVVAAVMRGKSRRAAAAPFDVSVASVVKWTQRASETGSPRPGRWAANGPIFWQASATGCWLVSTRSPI